MSDRDAKIREVNRLRKIEEVKRLREAAAADRPEPKAAVGDSAIMGAVEGTPLGSWVDETAGAVEALGSLAGVRGLGGSFDDIHRATDEEQNQPFGDIYEQARDAKRAAYQKAQDDNPGAYLGGQVVGGLASAALPVGTAASTAGKVSAAVGAGGLSAAGFSEANPFESPEQLGEFAKDVGGGMALGGLTQYGIDKAAPVVAKVAGKLPGALKDFAERRAFKAAVGNQAKVYDEATQKGIVNKVGRDLLDDEVVQFGSSAQDIADRAGELRSEAWEGMKGLFKQIDDEAPGAVDGSKIASRIREYAASIDSPNTESTVSNLLRQADKYEAMGAINLGRAQGMKNTYKWRMGDSLSQEATNEVKKIVGEEMEGAVEAYVAAAKQAADEISPSQFGEVIRTGTDNIVSRPQSTGAVLREATDASEGNLRAAELYRRLKERYGSFATAEDAAETLANRHEKNRTFSLKDTILAAGQFAANPGNATLGAIKGAAVAGGNKILRERGSSMAAVGADKLADILQRMPETFGRFAPQLQEAARRGNHALAVTHFLLMQNDPDYRDTVQIQE